MGLLYASLDDAWAQAPAPRKAKKEKRKSPLCSLYNQSTSQRKEMDEDFMSFYDETEMSAFAQRDTQTPYTRYSVEPAPQQPSASIVYQEYSSDPDLLLPSSAVAEEAVDDESSDGGRRMADTLDYAYPRRAPPVVEGFLGSAAPAQAIASTPVNVLDFVLYVVSGIFLIFAMEQVLQLGIRLR